MPSRFTHEQGADVPKGVMGKVLEDEVKDRAGRWVIAELMGCVKNFKFYSE